ncbi:MAG: helix-turn-helix domain-containing protein [Clostridia bacterium]|nr:helix-turn-helix domain-containing protein [Clostridia bacterium]
MRIRTQALGNRNIVGAKVEARRKAMNMKQKDLLLLLQIKGLDINASGLSKLEGQLRYVTDFELKALSEALEMSVNELLGIED